MWLSSTKWSQILPVLWHLWKWADLFQNPSSVKYKKGQLRKDWTRCTSASDEKQDGCHTWNSGSCVTRHPGPSHLISIMRGCQRASASPPFGWYQPVMCRSWSLLPHILWNPVLSICLFHFILSLFGPFWSLCLKCNHTLLFVPPTADKVIIVFPLLNPNECRIILTTLTSWTVVASLTSISWINESRDAVRTSG